MKRHTLAIGLEYDEGTAAPSVSIQEQERMADEVVRLARRYGVPVIEKPALANALRAVELDDEIPHTLFESVAIVLCEIDRKFKKLFGR